MSTITNEQIFTEIETIKQQVQQVHDLLKQLHAIQTSHPHIVKIDGVHGGEPIVRHSSVTVRTIVQQVRLGTTPEQLVEGYPPLTLAEIHDALSYYYDHIEEIEGLIAEHGAVLARAIELSARVTASKPDSKQSES